MNVQPNEPIATGRAWEFRFSIMSKREFIFSFVISRYGETYVMYSDGQKSCTFFSRIFCGKSLTVSETVVGLNFAKS